MASMHALGKIVGCAASLAAFAASSLAVAGPTWDVDYSEDAGQTAATAQVITIDSPIINIFGRLTGFGFMGSDLVDMYRFDVTSPTIYAISTAGGAFGGDANFDTQLFLFRQKGGNGANQRAMALKANNNAAEGVLGSRIGEGGINSNAVFLTPGTYYIAITGFGMNAVSDRGGSIWTNFGLPGQTIDGRGRELDDWSGTGAVGEYVIRLERLQNLVPAPAAVALIGFGAALPRRRRSDRGA